MSIQLAIGSPVFFHSRQLAEYERPRIAYAQPGPQPNLFNLVILADVLLDVVNGRQPPLLTRRAVPVFDEYPDNWPNEDFAVFVSSTAVSEIPPGTKPKAGKRIAQVWAGKVIRVERKPEEEQIQGTAAKGPHTKVLEALKDPGTAAVVDAVVEGGVAAVQAMIEPLKPAAAPVSLHGAMKRLLASPPFQRAIEEHPDVLQINASADSVLLHNPKASAQPRVELTHEPEGDDAGYKLMVAGKCVVRGIRDTKSVQAFLDEAFQQADKVETPPKLTPKRGTQNGKHTPKRPTLPPPPAKGKGKGK